jgi:hypothetical protein
VLAAVQMLENKMWAQRSAAILEPYVEVPDFAALLIARFVFRLACGKVRGLRPLGLSRSRLTGISN